MSYFTIYPSSSAPVLEVVIMWKGVSSVSETIMLLKVCLVSDVPYDVIPVGGNI